MTDHGQGRDEDAERGTFFGGDRGGDSMSFLEHLEELRWVVVRAAIAFGLAFAVVAAFLPRVSGILQHPIEWAHQTVYSEGHSLITMRPMEVFSVMLQVCFLGSLGLSLPFILYFAARFVAPGLTWRERRLLRPVLMVGFALFLLGAALAFFAVLPAALAVSLKFNDMFGYQQMWTAGEYYSLVVWSTLLIGLCFEFPLVIVALTYLEILPVRKLVAARRFVVVIVLILAALMTPGGDPLSLAVLSLPMYGLYELAIVAGRRIERRLRQDADEDALE